MSKTNKINAKKSEAKIDGAISHVRKKESLKTIASPVDQILHLQRTIGNQAVQRLFKSGTLQAKLKIGKPGDKYEKEADRVADIVMRMPEPKILRQPEEEEEEELIQPKPIAEQITPLVQRQAEPEEEEEEEPIQTKPITEQNTPLVQRQTEEEEEELVQPKPIAEQVTPLVQRQEEEEEEPIQTKPITEQITPVVQRQAEEEEEEKEEEPVQTKENSSTAAGVTPGIESNINSLKGSGQPLPESTRSYFEPRFGYDFSGVRVHTDSKASETAKSINAKAFTTGKDVVFGTNQYTPKTDSGKYLLAHELTHVIQQSGSNLQLKHSIDQLRENYEQETDRMARPITEWEKRPVQKEADYELVRRQVEGEKPALVPILESTKQIRARGGLANKGKLVGDMTYVIDRWDLASTKGILQLLNVVISKRIQDLESGSWESFWMTLLGNTIWATSAFAPIATAPLLPFVISMTGVLISSLPSLPKQSYFGENINIIQEGLLSYIENVAKQLKKQCPAKADKLLSYYQKRISRHRALAEFIGGFGKGMHDIGDYTTKPALEETAIRRVMYGKAKYEFDAAEKVYKAIGHATAGFKRLGKPLPGVIEKRPRHFGGYIILEDKIEVVTNLYGHRANSDIEYPKWGLSKPIPSYARGSIPPTSYFYHWLSRFAFVATTTEKSKILTDLHRIRTSLKFTREDQVKKRVELYKAVKERIGGRKPSLKTLGWLAKNHPKYSDLGKPLLAGSYEKTVIPIFAEIWEQLYAIQRQIGQPEVHEHVKKLIP